MNNKNTRFQGEQKSQIDHFYSNMPKKIKYVTQNDDTNDDTKKSNTNTNDDTKKVKIKKTDETYFTTKIEELVQRKKIVYEKAKKNTICKRTK